MVGDGLAEDDLRGLLRVFLRNGHHVELGEDEVAVAAAGTLAGQARIGHGFEAEAGDAGQVGLDRHRVSLRRGVRAAGEHGFVGLLGQRRPFGRLHLGGLQDGPAYHIARVLFPGGLANR